MDAVLYRTLLLFAATILVIWGFLLVLSPFLLAIAWALCLAAITYKPYLVLARRWRKPRMAALVMVMFTAIAILVPLGLVLFLAGEELLHLGRSGISSWVADLRKGLPSVYAWLNAQLEGLGVDGVDAAATSIAEAAPEILMRPIASGAWSVLGSFFTTVMGLVIMLATQFFVYTESGRLRRFATDVSPLDRDDSVRILDTLRDTTASAVLGGILVALIQGALGGIGFAVIGVQAPVLWGLVMAFFSLLPMGGAALVWGPVCIYLFAIGEPGRAWFLFAWGAVLVGMIDNFLRPWLLRRAGSSVHPMLLFFAILSGIGLFGMSGIVFGPLLIALLQTTAEIYRDHQLGKEAPVGETGDLAAAPEAGSEG